MKSTESGKWAAKFKMRVASEIVRLREARGYSRQQLAERADLPLPTIEKLEKNGRLSPFFKLWQIADALETSPEAILEAVQVGSPAIHKFSLAKSEWGKRG